MTESLLLDLVAVTARVKPVVYRHLGKEQLTDVFPIMTGSALLTGSHRDIGKSHQTSWSILGLSVVALLAIRAESIVHENVLYAERISAGIHNVDPGRGGLRTYLRRTVADTCDQDDCRHQQKNQQNLLHSCSPLSEISGLGTNFAVAYRFADNDFRFIFWLFPVLVPRTLN